MSPKAQRSLTPAQEWRILRRVFPIYQALAAKFGVASAPAANLRELSDSPDLASMEAAIRWAADVDRKIAPHQLRQFLQGGSAGNSEEQLHALLERYLAKEPKSEQDRDKVDALLTQYFHVCAPPSYRRRDIRLEEVAEVLQPVLGEIEPELPEWLEPLEAAIQQAVHCKSLRDLESSGVLGVGRQLKLSAGDKYFAKQAMLAFSRFNYVLRQSFLELKEADLGVINAGLAELARRGVLCIDASRALFSPAEPIANLQGICGNWRERHAADYFSDYSYVQLLELRTAIEEALHPPVESRVQKLENEIQEVEQQVVQTRAFLQQLRAHLEQMRSALSASNTLLNALQKDVEALRGGSVQPVAGQAQHLVAALPPAPTQDDAVTEPPGEVVEEEMTAEEGVQAEVVEAEEEQVPEVKTEPVKAEEPPAPVPAPKVEPVQAVAKPVEPVVERPRVQAAAATAQSAPVAEPARAGVEAKAPANAPAVQVVAEKAAPAASVAAATTTEPKPEHEPSQGQSYHAYFQEWIERLKGVLKARANRRGGAFNLVVGSVSVLLTSSEVAAFLLRSDNVGAAIQRGVIGRILLVNGLDTYKTQKNAAAALKPLIKVVEAEREYLQEVAKQSKGAEDRDALAATEMQLSAMLERAKKLVGK